MGQFIHEKYEIGKELLIDVELNHKCMPEKIIFKIST